LVEQDLRAGGLDNDVGLPPHNGGVEVGSAARDIPLRQDNDPWPGAVFLHEPGHDGIILDRLMHSKIVGRRKRPETFHERRVPLNWQGEGVGGRAEPPTPYLIKEASDG
jgi:hypothetical protein